MRWSGFKIHLVASKFTFELISQQKATVSIYFTFKMRLSLQIIPEINSTGSITNLWFTVKKNHIPGWQRNSSIARIYLKEKRKLILINNHLPNKYVNWIHIWANRCQNDTSVRVWIPLLYYRNSSSQQVTCKLRCASVSKRVLVQNSFLKGGTFPYEWFHKKKTYFSTEAKGHLDIDGGTEN